MLKRATLSVLAVIALLAIAGFTYNLIARHADARRFPQHGRSIRLGPGFGTESLNLNCSGQGSPAAILDGGVGVPAIGWKKVQRQVAKFTRVCSYDRAGYGWSSSGPMPRTSREIARELHALLVASGEKPPYILVGHSFGGFNVRMYNAAYPEDVAGVVLVDASSEDGARAQQSKRSPKFEEFLKKQDKELKWELTLAPARILFGIARLMDADQAPPYFRKEDWDELRYLEMQPKFYRAAGSEMDSFSASADEVRAAGTLGDKPLIVLTAAKVVPAPPGLPQEDFDKIQKNWVDNLQVREAQLSTRGRQIILRDSSHTVPFERPDAVVDAIHQVWLAAR